MDQESYDLVVIGTGAAATSVASRMKTAGWTVAVVDQRPFGGTCALRGCDPKKVLVGGAETVDAARRMLAHGVRGDIGIDWRALMAFKRAFTAPVPEEREKLFRDSGIMSFHGHAHFTDRDTIDVDGNRLKGRHILLAVGARPVPLAFPGAEHVVTSDAFLDLETLPSRIVMVGGGYIAAEFSHIAARAGAKVTIVQRGERLLTHFDPDLVGWLMDKFWDLGIDVRVGASVEAVGLNGSGFIVQAHSSHGIDAIEADLVVHAAGRAPDLDSLALEAAGIDRDGKRLKLNEFLQSASNPVVYAAGDAASLGPPLTPVASHDAEVVAANLLDGNRHRPNYLGVPSVAFTVPPITAVGLTEETARQHGLRFCVNSQKASGWYTARRLNEQVYGFKTLIEEDTDRILGAHLVGPAAEDVINVFALAIRHDITATALKETIFSYPTAASDIGHMV